MEARMEMGMASTVEKETGIGMGGETGRMGAGIEAKTGDGEGRE